MSLFPVLAFAAFDDVNLGGGSNTVFTINSITLNVVGGGSSLVSQVTANSDTLVVVLAPGSAIAVSSPGRATLSHDAASAYVTRDACDSDQSVLTLSNPASQSGSVTVTITPSSTTCSSSGSSSSGGGGGIISSGGGGGGSGGSGGGSTAAPAPAPAPAPSPTPTPTFSAATFVRFLTIGGTGDDVATLQTFLEGKGFLVIPPGIAKGYFGGLTKSALAAYQKSVGIDPLGIVGPATRAHLNAELSTAPSPAPSPTPTPTPSAGTGIYARLLTLGSTGDDVAILQTFLERKGFLVIPPGIAKGYFGPLTKAAVAALQLSIGLEGVGHVGPATRAYLNAN